MAGVTDHALAVAVAEGGGLGAIACALLSPEQVRVEVDAFRARVAAPINLNFFCHVPADDPAKLVRWRSRLAPLYRELGLDPEAPLPAMPARMPFDDAMCAVVEQLKPDVVSFHFGLPVAALVARVKAAGATVISSATTVAEARWLVERGCDAVIAQGWEAGGHRGIFLDDDLSGQLGTFALVPQIVDAVRVPVIAAGGIADARGIRAALALGASAVQIGTAYLRCPEAKTSALHRASLDQPTVVTNVLTGRPARAVANRFVRELGPLSPEAPAFPAAAGPLMPLRMAAEARGSFDMSMLYAGQAAPLSRAASARELTAEWLQASGSK